MGYCDRAFSTAGPKLWNEVPLSLRKAIKALMSSKVKLKYFYLNKHIIADHFYIDSMVLV